MQHLEKLSSRRSRLLVTPMFWRGLERAERKEKMKLVQRRRQGGKRKDSWNSRTGRIGIAH